MLSVCHSYYSKKKRIMSRNSTFLSQEALMSGKKIPKYSYFSNLFIFGGCQRKVFFASQTTTKLRHGEQVIVHMTLL